MTTGKFTLVLLFIHYCIIYLPLRLYYNLLLQIRGVTRDREQPGSAEGWAGAGVLALRYVSL